MDIKEEKKVIKNLKASYMEDWDLTEDQKDDLDALVYRVLMVGKEEGKQQTTPEGFVLIGKECPDPIFADNLFADLKTRSFICDGEEFINLCDIDPIVVWKMVIEAQEQSHD